MYNKPQTCEELKRDRDSLQRELERERDEREREQERVYQAQEQRRREHRREYQESLCHAENWPDAFDKGLSRITAEARSETQFNEEFGGTNGMPDHLFQDWLKEVTRAKTIYFEVMAETEKQIEELRKNALNKTADKLAEEYGESDTVEALREDNPGFLVEW